jgi:prevent-host-death family protein
MRVASLAEIKAKLSAYVQEAEKSGPIVVTRNGKAVAVIVTPVDDEDLEQILLARSPRFGALLKRSRESIASGRGLGQKEFWEEVHSKARRKASAGESWQPNKRMKLS